MATITVTLFAENSDGGYEEIQAQFPCKKEVCPSCDGEGFVLTEGLRGVAFSADEFYETFEDEEQQAEYFRRGGIYDVHCPTCQGQNVVSVVDEQACARDPELTRLLGLYHQKLEDEAQLRAEEAAERRMGC